MKKKEKATTQLLAWYKENHDEPFAHCLMMSYRGYLLFASLGKSEKMRFKIAEKEAQKLLDLLNHRTSPPRLPRKYRQLVKLARRTAIE